MWRNILYSYTPQGIQKDKKYKGKKNTQREIHLMNWCDGLYLEILMKVVSVSIEGKFLLKDAKDIYIYIYIYI